MTASDQQKSALKNISGAFWRNHIAIVNTVDFVFGGSSCKHINCLVGDGAILDAVYAVNYMNS